MVKEKIVSVKNLMQNMKWSVDQALNALGIQGDERKMIMEQLQKKIDKLCILRAAGYDRPAAF